MTPCTKLDPWLKRIQPCPFGSYRDDRDHGQHDLSPGLPCGLANLFFLSLV